MKGFIRALQNLSRIYITDLEFSEETFGRATMYFPLVGFVIGIILLAIYAVTIRYFANSIVAAFLLVSGIIISGGMHMDGFVDSMDGLFSGRPKERKLEIMKDSRVGANGVIGLLGLFILKFALLNELTSFKTYYWLLLMPVISRWCMVYAIRFFPYGRPEGMGRAYHVHTNNKEFVWATVFTLLLSILSFNLFIILVLAIIILVTHLMARRMVTTLGGLTGDTYGAITEITEVLLLIMFYLMIKY